jgi:hypothetical protein
MSDQVVMLTDLDDEANAGAADLVSDETSAEALPEGLIADGEGYRLPLHRRVTIKFKSSDGAVREESFAELPMRRLTGGDMRQMMTSDRRDGALLLLELAVTLPASRTKTLIDRLDAPDLRRAMAVVAFLAGTSPQTGL